MNKNTKTTTEKETDNNFNKTAFGKRLNAARKERGISSERLSEMCDKNAVFFRHIESAIRLPSLPVFVQICNSLRISPNYLLVDSLEWNEEDKISELDTKLRSLSPRQLDIAVETINTLIDKLLNDSETDK